MFPFENDWKRQSGHVYLDRLTNFSLFSRSLSFTLVSRVSFYTADTRTKDLQSFDYSACELKQLLFYFVVKLPRGLCFQTTVWKIIFPEWALLLYFFFLREKKKSRVIARETTITCEVIEGDEAFIISLINGIVVRFLCWQSVECVIPNEWKSFQVLHALSFLLFIR